MINSLFLPAFEKAINAYLRLDTESARRLKRLNGKTVTIELLPFHFIFQLEVSAAKIQCHLGERLPANTKIIGTPLRLLSVMTTKHNRQAFFADDLKMEGDAEFGRHVIELFDDLEVDWEEHCAKVIGDVPAHHLGRALISAKHWLRKTGDSFSRDISEYLHEETHIFPPPEALNDFYNDIDQLRMDVDRMEARLRRIIRTEEDT